MKKLDKKQKHRFTHTHSVSDIPRFVFLRKLEWKVLQKSSSLTSWLYNQETEVQEGQMNFPEPQN